MSNTDTGKVITGLAKRETKEQEVVLSRAVNGLLEGTQVESSDLEAQVLQEVLVNAAKQDMQGDDVNSALKELGLNISVDEQVCLCLRQKLTECDFSSLPTFEHLDWKLQAELSKSHMLSKYFPEVMLRFTFEREQERKIVRCDIPSLLRLKSVVEEALVEAKDPRLQKLLRKLR